MEHLCIHRCNAYDNTKETGMGVSKGTVGLPHGSDHKESACNARNPGSIPGLGRSLGGGHGNPPQYSCLENPMERSLAVYSPWGDTELDMTEAT